MKNEDILLLKEKEMVYKGLKMNNITGKRIYYTICHPSYWRLGDNLGSPFSFISPIAKF